MEIVISVFGAMVLVAALLASNPEVFFGSES